VDFQDGLSPQAIRSRQTEPMPSPPGQNRAPARLGEHLIGSMS
jgi:hypothetical protein